MNEASQGSPLGMEKKLRGVCHRAASLYKRASSGAARKVGLGMQCGAMSDAARSILHRSVLRRHMQRTAFHVPQWHRLPESAAEGKLQGSL